MSEQDNRKNLPEEQEHKEGQEDSGYRFMDQTIKKRPVSRKTIVCRVLAVIGTGVAVGLIASLVLTLTQPAAPASAGAEVSGKAAESEEVSAETSGETAQNEEVPAETSAEAAVSEEVLTEASGETAKSEEVLTESAGEAAESEEVPAEASKEAEESGEVLTEAPVDAADSEKELTEVPAVESTAAEAEADGKEIPVEKEEDPADTAPERITLQDYRQLYMDMMEVAEGPEHALVQVIGITNELDYFNQNYENQRRTTGLVTSVTDTDLYVVTEYRVIDNVERIQIVFYDGSMTDATFQKADLNTGLAALKVPLNSIKDSTKAELATADLGNSYTVSRGEPILALGNPLGFADSVAYGMVTSTTGKVPVADTEYALLTTDIEGSADGSGILVDLDGKVIGIITSQFGSSTGSITGLAITQIKDLIADLSAKESQNYVGIVGQDVTQDIADRTGIPKGMLVTEVVQNSPAMLAGIKEFDVIVRIGDRPVSTIRGYHKAVEALEAGDTVKFTAMRRGTQGYAEMPFEVTVRSR